MNCAWEAPYCEIICTILFSQSNENKQSPFIGPIKIDQNVENPGGPEMKFTYFHCLS